MQKIESNRESSIPIHHPGDEVLMDYALGTLPEIWSVAVATHLALCPDCRGMTGRLEHLGGALLAAAAPVPLQCGMPEPAEVPAADSLPAPPIAMSDPLVPRPLRDYLPATVDRLPWQRLMSGVEEFRLAANGAGGRASLLRIGPGRAIPQHTHRGEEMTLVLAGGYTDRLGAFRRGDFSATDASIEHRPVAMMDAACICLVATDAPVRLTGWLGRLLNPFLRY